MAENQIEYLKKLIQKEKEAKDDVMHILEYKGWNPIRIKEVAGTRDAIIKGLEQELATEELKYKEKAENLRSYV